MKALFFLIPCLVLAMLAGCVTPQTRIGRNPEAFAGLSLTDQQLIRDGKVAVGFTPEMVRLALGEPDRVYTRTDASGVNEAWSYTTYETESGVLLYRGFYHRHWRDPMFYPYYTSYPDRQAREYFKVVFAGGRVALIESQN